MRLVCPNCEAKYEVPDDAIPDTGRDVQCANCGHAWFQMRSRSAAALSVAEVLVAAMPAEAEATGTDPAAVAPAPAEASAEVALDVEVVAADQPADGAADGAVADTTTPDEAAPEPHEPDLASSDDPLAVAPEPELQAELAAEPELAPELAPEPEPVPEPVPMAEAEPEPIVAADPEPVVEIASEAVVPEPVEEPATEDGPAAVDAGTYAVDDSVLAILREEAEREANARRADALESQTELGIDTAMPITAAALAADADTRPSARRDLLPDVEEINSTLRPSDTQGGDATDFAAPPPIAPRGFRSGFLAVMTIAILGAALYVVAPRLGAMVPSLSDPLDSYVSVIDSLRLGLDGVMRSATVAINGG